MASQAVCGGCGAYLPAGAEVCERCGWERRTVVGGPDLVDRLGDWSWHALWKWVWVFWTIAYSLFTIGAYIQYGGQYSGAFASLTVAGSLAWPWLVGVITFGVLYAVTRTEHES